ncbi:ImmA/IrrE family metallo-endopeptidase [Jiulongibacter sediminis]|uniref:HTH cro/C1-type domain-containing protein n=1 Tax=Jiulongibacter sediminis TaxID=1605367 RepID=A0A0P7C151_9BACT|nr:ImmA/IrrE family metallo-endopeptidase [Jiulongibacter sediminis]KPM48333.1 hypothetical protein AFM12_06695 [Jiulongibacter sediminis]TBX24870.1 hypothetical protein TK44_06700 [Jiulongibacter sediminis]
MYSSLVKLNPNWLSHPGQSLYDVLEEKRMSPDSLAEKIKVDLNEIQEILKGQKDITDSVATKLENELGIPQKFWLSRQRQYKEFKQVFLKNQEKAWLDSLPIKDMIKFGWLSGVKSELTDQCLDFFNLKQVPQSLDSSANFAQGGVRFRTSTKYEAHIGSTNVWIRQGERCAEKIECNEWNLELLCDKLESMRALCNVKKPNEYIPKLKEICAECGIILVVIRPTSGCRASGATKFLPSGKALILMSFRHKSDDHFWFTFFHEIGHLIYHNSQQRTFVDEDSNWQENLNLEEQEANKFSGDLLIPYSILPELSKMKRDKRTIVRMALKLGVSPGILIGQMQHHNIIDFSYLNGYKRRYSNEEIPFDC